MNREESKAAMSEAYTKGYHEGFNDACDTMMLCLHKVIIDYLVDMKRSAKESRAEVIDEYEEGEE